MNKSAPTVSVISSASSSGERAASSDRIAALDGLRGIAVLTVLLYHAFHLPLATIETTGLTKLVAVAAKAGWLGVDLFFVLSGFLITGILLDSKDDPHYFRNFYARRVLRIVPLYLLALLTLLIFYQYSGAFVLLGAAYLTNFAALFGVPMLFGPLWSLSVEEHFYLLWPWLVKVTSRRMMFRVAAAICVLSPLARAVAFAHVSPDDIYYFSWFRFDGLAWGALLAMFYRSALCDQSTLQRLGRTAIVIGSLLLIAGLPFGMLSRQTFAGSVWLYTAAQVIFTGVIGLALRIHANRLKQLLEVRPLTWVGDVSYCFYLVHVFCFHAWDWLVVRFEWQTSERFGLLGNVMLRAVTGSFVAFVLAALSWRYVERPILKLKRRFERRPLNVKSSDAAQLTEKAA